MKFMPPYILNSIICKCTVTKGKFHILHGSFLVKNTNTAFGGSRHKEQRGSLTYYAMARLHKIALGVEATRNCFLPEAIAFLTIAVNAALEEAGIRTETTPSEDYLIIGREMKEKKGKSRSGKNRRTDEMAKT